ncbi:hypothetical protein P8452_71561 [Trifolium repens]|nr:hypothetical protein P8452_71561 [Trifolium repens]
MLLLGKTKRSSLSQQVHKLGFEEAANQNGEVRFLVDENAEIQETPVLRGSTCFLEWERRFGFRTNIGFTRSFHMVAADINVNEANEILLILNVGTFAARKRQTNRVL